MYPILKRGFDLIAALSALLLLGPLLLLVALVIALREGAPVLHREARLGRGQRPFVLLKFRSLHKDAPLEPRLAPDGDPRVTPTGRWLRRWRIDEFPSLINVLLGHMSLVGPRPVVEAYAQHMTPAEREIIYSVRPGLTDRVAVEFLGEDAVLAGAENPEALYFARFFHPKMQLSVEEIRRASFSRDLGVLFLTASQLWSPAARRDSERAMDLLLNKTPETGKHPK